MLKETSYKKLYLTKPQKRAYLLAVNWLVALMSRGTGKTTRIQAIRSLQTAQAVPGGLSVFYNATYIGAQQRTVSDTIKGWKEMGLREGRDFVKNIKPPEFYKESSYQPLNYKNVITHKSGHTFLIASNDRPGLVNSLSITGGIFVDEFRFINEPLMRQDLYPAIRGKNVWGSDNPFVFSRTYTSDMPFIEDEAEWIWQFLDKMNPEQIKLIVQAAVSVEKLKNKIIEYQNDFDNATNLDAKNILLKKIVSQNDLLTTKEALANKIRMNYKGNRGSVYFDTASFLSNLNILGLKYFTDNADPNNKLVTKTSFLNIKPEEVESKFYSQLKKKHFIQGTFDYEAIENKGIPDLPGHNIVARNICEYDPLKEIDLEIDYGDMCSCSISQTYGREEIYIASFEVLTPFDVDDLMTIVNRFLAGHEKRVINLYKDPSGNWMRNRKDQTYGPQTIQALKTLKWYVIDKTPEGSINPAHNAKYQLINKILKEDDLTFPVVRIIRETNLQLESSLMKAPRRVEITKDNQKIILKDKRSEKELPLEKKPMGSTDHSDHFDIKLWHKYNRLIGKSSW